MAFLESAPLGEKKERFSLLLLDPGEIYFQDFSAILYPWGSGEGQAIDCQRKGRLKICSKSLVFDPREAKYPLTKIPFKDITSLGEWQGPLLSRLQCGKLIHIRYEQQCDMRQDHIISPYHFTRGASEVLVGLVYGSVEDCIHYMSQLQRAATLPTADHTMMINAIVLSRQSRVKFDTSWLEDLHETIIMETQGNQVCPLVINPGRVMLTSHRLYFQPFNNITPLPVLKINLSSISRIISRRFLLKQIGIEIFCDKQSIRPSTHSHLYLAFHSQDIRDQLYSHLLNQSVVQLSDEGQENMTLKWQAGILSNYDYLLYLNSLADRSINDLTQYPVLPWVIADYTSNTLDLDNPAIFRDLHKPIGALNPHRLQKLVERSKDMPEGPKFLYGSHYSTPGYILFYLARQAPEYVLCLQNGRFDQPDRMFNSITHTWTNCLTSMSDFKELIPEFYDSQGDFLLNKQMVDFGVRQGGEGVENVELPPWAKDAKDFITKNRSALESAYVSENLHHWIDLIFGYKQTGEHAECADNVFYHLTYEGAVDLDSIEDPNERAGMEIQIMEFGQTPKQIFKSPHPCRQVGLGQELVCNIHSSSVTNANVDASPVTGRHPDVPSLDIETPLTLERTEPPLHCEDHSLWGALPSLTPKLHHSLHKGAVTDVRWSESGNLLYSVSQDCLLKIYSLPEKRQVRSISLTTMALSSLSVFPDESTVIIGSWDNNIYLYNIEFGRVLREVCAHDDAVTHIHYCYHENLLLSSSWDSLIKLWKYESSSRQTAHLEITGELEHETGVTRYALDSSSERLAAATRGGQLCVWDIATQTQLVQLQGHIGEAHDVAFCPAGHTLVSCGSDGCIKVTDARTGTEVCNKTTGQQHRCVAWDGRQVLVGCDSGALQVWDIIQLKQVHSITAHSDSISCMAIKGQQLATGGHDHTVRVWEPGK